MRSARSALAAVFAAVVVAACGSPSHGAAPSATDQSAGQTHNANDIAFARSMIPHHEQAIDMAQMVPTNTKSQGMVALANHITNSEAPEIQAFRVFLMQWQDAGSDDASGHSGVPLPGTIEGATMDKLRSINGPDFDRLWLTTMIAHHRGAIAIAQNEVASGKNADVIYLAKTIVTEQQTDIDIMNNMLGG